MNSFKSIDFRDDQLILIDQTKLPLREEYIRTDNVERIAVAIERLEVRGAPAIGVTAAYGLALAVKNSTSESIDTDFESAYQRLKRTRPTAVNLFWALDSMKMHFTELRREAVVYPGLLSKAKEIHDDDIQKCDKIAEYGLEIFGSSKSKIITHCNTGQLATGGGGTAFYVIKNGHDHDKVEYVYADETRPLLQGSRLTAFELEKAGVPFSIISDSSAAFTIKNRKIDIAIVGADRIAANGDTANKIGTYNLAVVCAYHKLPFYIAAPTSTIDPECKTGAEIKIEERDRKEITEINGRPITKENYNVFAPAFDVTPSELITGIITEKGIFKKPFGF